MQQTRSNTIALLACIATLAGAGRSNASVVYSMEQVGDDVVLSYTGTINDLDGLSFLNDSISFSGYFHVSNGIGAGKTIGNVEWYEGTFIGPDAIGTGTAAFNSDTDSGPYFGIDFGTFGDVIFLPEGYVPGTPMSGSSTFEDTTIVGLGADTPQTTFVWELGNTAGDTITLNIIPEPSSLALLSVAGLVFARRRRG